ncbi:MAG TPA: hypothetical protein VMB77_04090 [Syntrophales bacterium]|nr:hypothetical protein [Syntrophales bacterium]
MAKLVTAGKNLLRFWNDPLGCYFYYAHRAYEIQGRNMEVQEALEMMATMIAI